MTKTTFTPGPLTANGNGVHKGIRCVAITYDPENGSRESEVAHANARLFAAAPALFSAVTILLGAMEMQEGREKQQLYISQPEAWHIWVNAKIHARAALALVDSPQATGESE